MAATRLPPGITRRASGEYLVRVKIGLYPNGQERYVSRTRHTLEAAKDALYELEQLQRDGVLTSTHRAAGQQRLGDYLQQWLPRAIAPTWKPNTVRSYQGDIDRIIAASGIAHVRLIDLTYDQARGALRTLVAAGYAVSTVRRCRLILLMALDDAVHNGVLRANMFQRVAVEDAPDAPTPDVWTPDQAIRFWQAAQGDPYEALWSVLLCGLRKNEAAALRWSDIQFTQPPVLHVNWNLTRLNEAKLTPAQRKRLDYDVLTPSLALVRPKTKGSRRSFVLPAFVVQALHRHRARQVERRLLMGTAWRDHNLVFTTGHGTPLHSNMIDAAFAEVCARAGLPQRGPHIMRHSAATLLLYLKVDKRTIMDMLGHATEKQFQQYAHVLEEMKDEAAAAVDAFMARVRDDVG
jgi:integrase